MGQMRSETLAGLRVIDLTQGPAGGLATMMLADFGADVIRVTKPGEPHPLDTLAAAPMWHRGKSALPLDLDDNTQHQQLLELCSVADVLVCSWRTAALARRGLDPDELRRRYPQLIISHISGYGHRGPLANLPGYEHVAAALTGRMQLFQGLVDRKGPVFSALQVGIHACAQSACSGVLAALHARSQNNQGCVVRTSVLQGLLTYEQGAMLGQQFRDTHPDAFGQPIPVEHTPPMPALYYHPAQAGDGRWMQFGNLLPHLFDNFLVATDLIDIVADPDFDPKQLLLPAEKHEAFRERMLLRIQDRTADEWMSDLIANGSVVATAYQTTQQALADPDIVANGHAIQADPNDNHSLQLGPVARLTQTPATPGLPLNDQGQKMADAWHANAGASPSSASVEKKTHAPNTELPLAGVRVLEIATIIAAPLGASLLADLGAEVIKVEQIGGDPYRSLLAGVGSARVNAGKRSLSVDLKSDAGKQMVLDLAAQADILIHNYRPGVPERLGIGYEQIAAINPDIIYLQSNGYGPDGPGAQRPSTHPIPGAAMGGVLYHLGERVPETVQDIEGLRMWTRRLMRANEVNPDPNTAVVVANSSLLGLVARDRTGQGQRILVDMFGANAYANHDDFLNYSDKPARLLPDEELRGLSPTYRLYQCADKHWVFLAMTTAEERNRFCAALVSAGVNAPSEEQLAQAASALASSFEKLFATKSASDWETLFLAHDIACVCADSTLPNDYWLEHPQAQSMQLTGAATHPVWGSYQRHGALVGFNDQPPPMAPPPLAGQHNAELLAEVGYTAEQIAALTEQGVIWSDSALEG